MFLMFCSNVPSVTANGKEQFEEIGVASVAVKESNHQRIERVSSAIERDTPDQKVMKAQSSQQGCWCCHATTESYEVKVNRGRNRSQMSRKSRAEAVIETLNALDKEYADEAASRVGTYSNSNIVDAFLASLDSTLDGSSVKAA
eukprot:gb/GFBE01043595.1/.p1 GENE.gb/GFBE01043595.1/~~gb/GFBE01043595.1/.p1  ORF type:complete len:144 (+),score=32.92 gb/GFBE01043595.1/:1-432(+)